MTPRVTLRHRIGYLGVRVLLAFGARLPESLAYGVAGALGRTFFRFSKRRRELSLRMLRNAFPERGDGDLLRIGRAASGHVFQVVVDMMRTSRMIATGRARDRFDLSGVRHLVPTGPWFALTGHLGSWEVSGVMVATLGHESHAIARTFKNPLLDAFLTKTRERGGLHLHPRRGGLRPVARAMRAGHVGMQVIDQHQRLRGIVVPFFGQPASTERAAATLAVRRAYPIMVGAAIRVGRGYRFRMEAIGPIHPRRTGDLAADVEHTVREVNAALETLIRRFPEQYLWMHDRYRVRTSP